MAKRIHYLHLHEKDEDFQRYAIKAGAKTSDWVKDIFDDLFVGHAGSLRYSAEGAYGRSSRHAVLIGQRFRCRAVNDEARKDALFIFHLGDAKSVPISGATRVIDADWRLVRAKAPQDGDNITENELPHLVIATQPPLVPHLKMSEELSRSLSNIFSRWDDARFVDRLPRRVPSAQEISTGLRPFGAWSSSIPGLTVRERGLLVRTISSADQSELFVLRSKLAIPLLEAVRTKKIDLEKRVDALLELSADVRDLRLLAGLWVDQSDGITSRQRFDILLRWARQLDEPAMVSAWSEALAGAAIRLVARGYTQAESPRVDASFAELAAWRQYVPAGGGLLAIDVASDDLSGHPLPSKTSKGLSAVSKAFGGIGESPEQEQRRPLNQAALPAAEENNKAQQPKSVQDQLRGMTTPNEPNEPPKTPSKYGHVVGAGTGHQTTGDVPLAQRHGIIIHCSRNVASQAAEPPTINKDEEHYLQAEYVPASLQDAKLEPIDFKAGQSRKGNDLMFELETRCPSDENSGQSLELALQHVFGDANECARLFDEKGAELRRLAEEVTYLNAIVQNCTRNVAQYALVAIREIADSLLGAIPNERALADRRAKARRMAVNLREQIPGIDEIPITWVAALREPTDTDDLEQIVSEAGREFAASGRALSLLDRLDEMIIRKLYDRWTSWLDPHAAVMFWSDAQSPASRLTFSALLHSIAGASRDVDELVKQAPRSRVGLIAQLSNSSGNLQGLHREIRSARDLFGRVALKRGARILEEATFEIIGLLDGLGIPPPPPPPSPAVRLKFGHCLSTGVKGGVFAAPLYVRQSDAPGLLLVDIPVYVTTVAERQPGDLKVSVQFRLPHLDGRQPDWIARGRERQVLLRGSDWKRSKDLWRASVILFDIPLTRQLLTGGVTKAIRIEFEDASDKTGTAIETGALHFGELVFDADPVSRIHRSHNVTNPADAIEHPVGVQGKVSEIMNQIENGDGSFLITAPRRSGKTTLVMALKYFLEDSSNVIVLGPISPFLIAPHNPVRRLSPRDAQRQAWHHAGDELQRVLNVAVPFAWHNGGDVMPKVDDLEPVRKRAFESGKRAIYLLFDEAQALFGGAEGQAYALTLKTRLENVWGQVDDGKGLAAIRVGLVGHPHLPTLMGQQLTAFFRTQYPDWRVTIEQLDDVFSKTMVGFLSSADARAVLLQESKHIRVLLSLLDALVQHVNKQGRRWFLSSDVEVVRNVIIMEAAGEANQVASYLRDELNGSDDLDVWDPIDEYPVAMAWAHQIEGATVATLGARYASTAATLTGWLEASSLTGAVDVGRVKLAVDNLQKRGTLLADTLMFESQLLQRLLARIACRVQPFPDVHERLALERLAVDVVQWPPEAITPSDSGGQAQVFRVVQEDGSARAYRLVSLPSDAERHDFLSVCDSIRLVEGTRQKHVGYMNLPRFKTYGFTDHPEPNGAIVYDWIEGQRLSDLVGRLNVLELVDIAYGLAQALDILSVVGVVHRDVRPENVVVDRDGAPVLLDFGLSRVLDSRPQTRFATTKYLAPEVLRTPAEWSPAADVFAWAVVIDELHAVDTPRLTTLDTLISKARSPDPRSRLSAKSLAKGLEKIRVEAGIETRREQARQRLEVAARQLTPDAFVVATLENIERIADRFGFVTAGIHRFTAIASWLNDAFEAWYWTKYARTSAHPLSFNNDTNVSIARLKTSMNHRLPAELNVLICSEFAVVGKLRDAEAHSGNRLEEALVLLRVKGQDARAQERALETCVRDSAALLDRQCGTTNAMGFVDTWLRLGEAASAKYEQVA